MTTSQTRVITESLILDTHRKMLSQIEISKVADLLQTSEESISGTFRTAVAESLQTLSLLTNLELVNNARILEVGAGYGMASICLAMMGFDVTALEPGGLSFEQNKIASEVIAKSCGVAISHVASGAEEADFSSMEKFDLVVSNNVLEHIPDVETALTNLNNSISENGLMIHSCANYTFPFEPHFGLPLIPLFPRLTKYVIPKSISRSALWNSLNFINMSQVRRNARKNNMFCAFRNGTMSKSIRRLHNDSEFAARHALIARFVSVKPLYRLMLLMTSLPGRVATPMDFVICPSNSSAKTNAQRWITER